MLKEALKPHREEEAYLGLLYDSAPTTISAAGIATETGGNQTPYVLLVIKDGDQQEKKSFAQPNEVCPTCHNKSAMCHP